MGGGAMTDKQLTACASLFATLHDTSGLALYNQVLAVLPAHGAVKDHAYASTVHTKAAVEHQPQ